MSGWVYQAFANAFEPKDYRSIDQWVDDVQFMLPSNTAEPGRYSIDRTPYQREILRAVSPNDPSKCITLVFGSQMGKTTVENIIMNYYIAEDPSPIGFAFSDEANLKNYVKNKFDPMLAANPWIKDLLRSEGKSAADSITSKQFPGGFLKFLSGKSEASMRSDSVRIMIADELDAMGITKGGDPRTLLAKRQNTFKETSKMILSSTPLNDGIICEYLEKSTYNKFFMPCPHCGQDMTFELEHLRWNAVGDGIVLDAWMECPHCHKTIRNEDKLSMMNHGRWVATNKEADPTNVGFYLPSFYAPVGWISFTDIAKDYVDAGFTSKGVDYDKLTTFYNTILGTRYIVGGENSQKWRALSEKALRSDYKRNDIPRWINFITTGTDVQKDRLEVSIYGWGKLGHSLAIDHIVIPIQDNELENPGSDTWYIYKQSTILAKFEREDGLQLRSMANAIDSSYKPDNVNAFYTTLSRDEKAVTFPIRGRDSLKGFTSVMKRGKVQGLVFWDVPVSELKHQLFDHLEDSMKDENQDNPYFMEFPSDFDNEYYQQLFGESWMKEGRKWMWKKTRNRNEVLDCTVYNLAMFYQLGLNNLTDVDWEGVAMAQQQNLTTPNRSSYSMQGRRMLSRGVM